MAAPVSNKIEGTLNVMPNELKDECLACLKLISQMDISSIITASAAFLALLFSVYVYWQTRRLLKPTERPLISSITSNIEEITDPNNNEIQYKMMFVFKNIGKHPSIKLNISLVACEKGKKPSVKQYPKISSANRLDTDQIFQYQYETKMFKEGQRGKIDILFYFLVSYDDYFTDRKYSNEYYLSYTIGEREVANATQEIKSMMESYMENIQHK